jgi:hypothetical protein
VGGTDLKPREEFLTLLENSKVVVWRVAEWLTGKGANVRLIPSTISPNEAVRFEHADMGDIEIVMRCEVKHRPTLDFMSMDDFPYPDIIIDETYKIEKFPKATLYGYVIVNSSMTAAITIPRETRKHWFEAEKFDKRDKVMKKFTFCPKKYLKVVPL